MARSIFPLALHSYQIKNYYDYSDCSFYIKEIRFEGRFFKELFQLLNLLLLHIAIKE